MQRRKALETLLRVRRLQRDAARQAEGKAARARLAAEDASRAETEAAAAAQRALQEHAERSIGAGPWRSAATGVEALVGSAVCERATLEAARAVEADAVRNSLAAERSLAGVEQRVERKAAEDRRQKARAAQRRIDDMARRKRSVLMWVLLLITAAMTHAAPSLAQTNPPGAQPEAQAADRLASASLERLLSDIRTRRVELERREAELEEREQAVAELERAVEIRIEELDSMATTIEERLAAWEESNAAKSVSKLAKIYGVMPPGKAAALIEELDLDLATQVLAKMKPKNSAALLPLLSEPRALAISRFVGHPLGVPPNVPAKVAK